MTVFALNYVHDLLFKMPRRKGRHLCRRVYLASKKEPCIMPAKMRQVAPPSGEWGREEVFRERPGKNEKPPKAAMGSELCIAPSGRHCSTDTQRVSQGRYSH